MAIRYSFEPTRSRFTVQAFASGLLSSLGHSPTFSVDQYSGEIRFGGGEVKNLSLTLNVQASSLLLVDQVSAGDRSEIEGRMRRDVLNIAEFPSIAYDAEVVSESRVAPGHYQLRLGGPLSLHGVSKDHRVDADLTVFEDGLILKGESTLKMSDYHIKPVSAVYGTIKLKDELKIHFDLGARMEES